MEWPAYRCFLPDLTGFAGFHCVGPDLQRRDTADCLAERPLGRGFSPAVADCGYRAPLAPRLARPEWMVRRGGERSKRAAARDHAARRRKLQTAARRAGDSWLPQSQSSRRAAVCNFLRRLL